MADFEADMAMMRANVSAGRTPALLAQPRRALWVVTGSHDHEVRIWGAVSGQCLAVLRDHCQPVTNLASAGGLLVSMAPSDCCAVYRRCDDEVPVPEAAAQSRRAQLKSMGALGLKEVQSFYSESVGALSSALGLEPGALALGTRAGDIVLYDFGPHT